MKSYPSCIQGLKEYIKTLMVVKVICGVNEFNQNSNSTFLRHRKNTKIDNYTRAIAFLNPQNKTNEIILSDFHTTYKIKIT